MSLIVFLNAHNLFESYFYYNDVTWEGLGLSYLHYHLIGALFLLYTYFLFRIKVNLKFWIAVIIVFTVARLIVLEPIDDDILDTATSFTPELLSLIADNFLSIFLNISLLLLAFLKIRRVSFVVNLTNAEKISYQWLKRLLLISIVLYIAIFISSFVSIFDEEEWLIYFKIESVFNSIFSLSLVYSTMRFPVFALHGDFRDLSEESRKKYAKSSLTPEALDKLWLELTNIMSEEKPYLDPEYRLNDLATRLDKSVHHVSQAVNEKKGVGFSDFINQFRVEDAKKLLASGRANQVTILAISLESGFNSKTAFYNTFKKVTGKTPTDFIKGIESQNTSQD